MSMNPANPSGLTGDSDFNNSLNSTPGGADLGDSKGIVDQLNSLLRGEISATETYRNVLDKVTGSKEFQNFGLLREIQEEHGRAAQELRHRIRELGGEAADSSGPWGVWAQTVQESMGLLGGEKGNLKALKEGEEHGLKDFQDALNRVDPGSAQLIQNRLAPSQERHISLLNQLINTGGIA